ncbi:Phenylalanine--tRNA ligase alpha subunit [Hibiscus syriacus]|uniref:phenylalanine--tRNA ligase n=2 Tax=Magnoliopsida TaxID=3398 RepID=A0A6A2ZLM5_HIBSY|nr:Phenylalanine--tRNA ligase alpha subunit [Hibiscus syriacus]
MSNDVGIWKWEDFEHLLPIKILLRIVTIKGPIPSGKEDNYGWSRCDDLHFTIKSAYEVRSMPNLEANDPVWKVINQYKGLQRIKIKVNTDGSRNVANGLASCEGVICNNAREWLVGFKKNLGLCSILEAKLWGVYVSLYCAWNTGMRKVIIECGNGSVDKLLKEAGLEVIETQVFYYPSSDILDVLMEDSSLLVLVLCFQIRNANFDYRIAIVQVRVAIYSKFVAIVEVRVAIYSKFVAIYSKFVAIVEVRVAVVEVRVAIYSKFTLRFITSSRCDLFQVHCDSPKSQRRLGFPTSLLSDREQGGLSRAAAVHLGSGRVGSGRVVSCRGRVGSGRVGSGRVQARRNAHTQIQRLPAAAMAEDAILGYLATAEEIPDSGQFAVEHGLNHNDAVNVIKSLHGFRYIDAQDIKRENWVLTDEGKKYATEGSPEVQLFLAIPQEGSISKDELQKKLEPSVFKIGCSQAGKNKWVDMGKQVSRKVQHVEDKVKDLLIRVQNGEEIGKDDVTSLKARKLIVAQIWKGYSVRKGPNYAPKRKKVATDLTRENLQRADWKELEFKEYNFNAKGPPAEAGHLHPLLKARICKRSVVCGSHLQVKQQLKNIFLQMGFEEMPTNNFVESSFWNFDALFQPQQHPARDSHDTFFLEAPSTTRELPEYYVELVKRVHESGGYGSRGYMYDWKREEANKNLLRTHTTAVSTRMLYALAKQPFAPKRYFSIDRVFRNESVDRTHLAEFHQIEGLVCDRGLTLGDLIGVLNDFFSRLGMSKLRFKPAYNPYTEPSMEIFSYHEGLKKWVEIGNSGMFRPEMLLPMGFPEDVRVIAWGLSLERPTMILYGIDNIRDLFGHKVDLSLIKRNPICRIGID